MADVNFPSVNDLGTMMNLPFPAYQQAQSQIGLANQFAQQNLQKGEAEQQAMQLANLFAAANNPQKLQQQALQNEGMGYDNRSRGVNARVAEGSEEETLNAKRMQALANASEDQLKIMQSRAIADYQSDDPEKRKSGEQRILLSKAERDRRMAQQDKLEQLRVGGDARLEGIRMAQEGMNGRNDASIAARLEAAAKKSTGNAAGILSNVQAGKMNFEKAATAFEVMASMEQDDARAAQYAEMAKKFATANMSQKNAAAGTKPDLASLGIQTNQFDLGVGGTPTRMPQQPGMMAPMTNGAGDPPARSGIVSPADEAHRKAVMSLSPTEQAYLEERDPQRKKALEDQIRKERENKQAPGQPNKAPAAPANVPQGAIQMLRSNPQLAAAFDQKYGAGAAARTLGK